MSPSTEGQSPTTPYTRQSRRPTSQSAPAVHASPKRPIATFAAVGGRIVNGIATAAAIGGQIASGQGLRPARMSSAWG
jgi:hypothetical protein